ncbi:hypothetical protein DEO72_LG3g2001 [Vigna unguiculata]|uniref:Uncharacterized protein n=1 Tax=Vigna unguiculata TaxID=3917 RepID=A0A4D6LGL3_VIGUN|nr:hypothetical protein DEO72_LG3g2001 [Vigna unguiculata]
MEKTTGLREDPPEELAESIWLVKAGYRGARKDIVALERVSVVDCVCHGQEGATEEFFYMYMFHFSQLRFECCVELCTYSHLCTLFSISSILGPRVPQPSYHLYVGRTDNPWGYKDMNKEKLSVADREVVDTLMKSYGIGWEDEFEALHKEKAAKAKAAGSIEVPNLREPLVEVDVDVHGGSKRKVELPARTGGGKDVKKVRVALLGPGSSSDVKGLEAGLIELPKIVVHRNLEINLSESLRELNECNGSRVEELMEELKVQADKHAEEKAAWKKAREEWLEEKKRISELEADYDELKEKNGGLELELEDLKGCIIQEHINGFQKCLRQAAFFYKDIDVSDARFDVNKDVVDGELVSEAGSSPEEQADKMAEGLDANVDDVVVVENANEGTT